MIKLLIALGIAGFIAVYFVLIPYILWTAPEMEDDDEENMDHRR